MRSDQDSIDDPSAVTGVQPFGRSLRACIDHDPHLTQHDVAIAAGVSDAAVSQWITGAKRPGKRSLIRLLFLLGHRRSVEPRPFDDLVRSAREDLQDSVAGANSDVLELAHRVLIESDPRQAQIAALMVQEAADACRSARDGAVVYARMCREDRFATPHRSSGLRRVVQLIALAGRGDLFELLREQGRSWELTVLAPHLVRFAPDAQSQMSAVDGVVQALIPCRGDSCSSGHGDPDVHLPDLFSFLYMCRAAVSVGMEQRVVDAISTLLNENTDQCASHAAFILQAAIRLARDQDSWSMAGPLVRSLAAKVGLDPHRVDWAAMDPDSEMHLVGAFARSVGSDAVPDLNLRWHATDWTAADRGAIAAQRAADLSLMLSVAETASGCDQVFLVSAASSLLRRSHSDFFSLDPSEGEICAYKKHLAQPLEVFLATKGTSVFARLIAAESSISAEILDAEDAVRAFLSSCGPDGEMALVASRWASDDLRSSAIFADSSFWSAYDMRIVDAQPEAFDETRMWVTGRALFAEPRRTAVDQAWP